MTRKTKEQPALAISLDRWSCLLLLKEAHNIVLADEFHEIQGQTILIHTKYGVDSACNKDELYKVQKIKDCFDAPGCDQGMINAEAVVGSIAICVGPGETAPAGSGTINTVDWSGFGSFTKQCVHFENGKYVYFLGKVTPLEEPWKPSNEPDGFLWTPKKAAEKRSSRKRRTSGKEHLGQLLAEKGISNEDPYDDTPF